MTLQISSSHGKELQGSYAVLPPPPPGFPFRYHFPRGVCKTFIHFKRCYGKFPSGSFLSGRDKYYSLQKSGLPTWKPNNWGCMNGQEAAYKGNPFWLHLSCCRTLECRRRLPLGLGCQVTRVSTDFHFYFISDSGKLWFFMQKVKEPPPTLQTHTQTLSSSLRLN